MHASDGAGVPVERVYTGPALGVPHLQRSEQINRSVNQSNIRENDDQF